MKHPILHLEVLAADGTQASDDVVFCRRQRQSVRVERCALCVHADAILDGAAPAVECMVPASRHAAEDPAGEHTEVGTLLRRGTLVVSESVPLAKALEVLRSHGRRSLAIVDAQHVMVGVLHEAASMSRLRSDHQGEVSAAMTSVLAIDECTPVRAALKLLAASHLREATVVSKRGVPIGLFRDVDGMAWLVAARDGEEPPEG